MSLIFIGFICYVLWIQLGIFLGIEAGSWGNAAWAIFGICCIFAFLSRINSIFKSEENSGSRESDHNGWFY